MKFAMYLLAAATAPLLVAPAFAQHGPGHGPMNQPGRDGPMRPGGPMGPMGPGHGGPMDPTPTMAAPYVTKAGASDLYEIQSSRIALQKSRNSQVRALATMLISHHQMTTRDVTAAARRDGLRPMAPRLEPHQAAMIADLRRASAMGFNRAFLDQQRTAHEQALNLHSNYAQTGDRRALRMAASKAVPIIERHIARIDAIRIR